MNAATDEVDSTKSMALPICHRRLVLTGFMGAGKSTAGLLLAARLGWEFLDLDALVETHAKMTVAAIFAAHGEPHFRKLESLALASTLGRNHIVLALGGGAPENLTNRLLLEQTPGTVTIFLDAPFSVLLDRCRAQAAEPPQSHNDGDPRALPAHSRPILADPRAAEARFHARQPIYGRLAHHTIQTAGLSTEQTVAAILARLAPATAPRHK